MTAADQRTPRIAAFFDLDGTLIPEPSLERRLFADLRREGKVPAANYLRWAFQACLLVPQGVLSARMNNKRHFTGISRELLYRYFDSITFFEEAVARVAWHARQGHEIVFVSGTLLELAQLAASAIECELELRGLPDTRIRVCATCFAQAQGYWTGRVQGEVLFGPAKARALNVLAREHNFVLCDCYAYGNELLDHDFLSAVGHAHIVNPSRELARLANEQDWPIWHWHVEKTIAQTGHTNFTHEIQHLEEQA